MGSNDNPNSGGIDTLALTAEGEAALKEKPAIIVPNLANVKSFDIGGGRIAEVRCAGDFTRGKLAQYAGFRNGESDNIELRQAALQWGVQSVSSSDGSPVLGSDGKPVTKVNRGPLIGHAYDGRLFDTIHESINDAMFLHVMNGANVSDEQKKA